MSVSLREFLKHLTQLELLTADQSRQLASLQQRFPAAEALGRELERRGWLTSYQLEQLLVHDGKGLVLGPYVLLCALGEGGMGQVFKAWHRRLGRTVALKLIRKERLGNPEAVRRFFREIRAVSQVSHPNIVHAFDADEVGGTHFYAMEYVEGSDLAAVVRGRGPLPVAEACAYVRQTALGLQHAHERGLVHRDIKPHNLLLTHAHAIATIGEHSPGGQDGSYGMVKILDLGLARWEAAAKDESTTMTREGIVMGTPDYIAPEQARSSGKVDVRADLYSLGCTFYFLLTGQPPFPGGSLTEKLLQHQLEHPTRVDAMRPEVPPGVARIVHKLLAKKPEQRFQTPLELAETLANADLTARAEDSSPFAAFTLPDNEASTPANPVSETIPAIALRRRKRRAGRDGWLIAGGVAIVAVLLAVLVLLINLLPRQPEVVEETPVTHTPAKKPTNKAPDPKKAAAEAAEAKAAADKRRRDQAETALAAIAPMAYSPKTRYADFAKDVASLRARFGGTSQAVQAAKLLMRMPSPLDRLDRGQLPSEALHYWQTLGLAAPRELVATYGDARGRHGARVQQLALSPDGNWVVSAGLDNWVKVWDARTRVLHAAIRGGTCAFGSDGRLLVVREAEVVACDVAKDPPTEVKVATDVPGWVEWIFACPDRNLFATTGRDLTIRLWELKQDKAEQRATIPLPEAQHLNSLAFANGGKLLVCGSHDKQVRFFDVAGTMPNQIPTADNHNDWVYSVAASPDAKVVASAGAQDWNVFIWRKATSMPKVTSIFPLGTAACSVAVSHDGKLVAAGGWNGAIVLYDVAAEAPRPPTHLQGHQTMVWALAFSADDQTLFSSGDDGTVRVWDVAKKAERDPLPGAKNVIAMVDFSPDDAIVLSASADNVVRGYDTARGVAGVATQGVAARWLAEGGIVRCGSDRALYSDKPLLFSLSDPAAFAPSPDGMAVLAGANNGDLALIDTRTAKEIRRWPAHAGGVRGVAFAPDGHRAVSFGTGPELIIWDVDAGRELERVKEDWQGIHFVAASPDGEHFVACTSAPHGARLFRWDGGEQVALWAAVGNVLQATFSPDGERVAVLVSTTLVRVYDIRTSGLTKEYAVTEPVWSLAFAHDGRHLALGHANSTVSIFRIDERASEPTGIKGSFASLFNRQDLKGWKDHPQLRANWVVDRTLLSARGGHGALFTERGDYQDFYLRAEVKINATGDSGIFFRSAYPGHGTHSYEAQIGKVPQDHAMTRWTTNRAGWQSLAAQPADRWFLLEILARGPHVVIKYDGRVAVDVVDPEPILDAGHIGLQHFNSETDVEFGMIEIMRLPPVVNTVEAQREQENEAKTLGVPVEITNSLGMKMRLIPPGEFLMGSPEGEEGRRDNEGPQHAITIPRPLYAGAYEVRQQDYLAVIGSNPSACPGDDHPVENVSRDDAIAFCQKLSNLDAERKAGRVYRLPTEAEWEYACRAGSAGAFPFEAERLPDYAWYVENDKAFTHPVGSKKPNAWGLHDMHGNVWEFCADFYDAHFYERSPSVDPQGPEAGQFVVIRGGARGNPWSEERCAGRWPNHPPQPHGNVGFRVVCDVPRNGFTPLFNGKDLSGWQMKPVGQGCWSVRDGMLVGEKGTANLHADRKDFRNFRLYTEFKINAEGDSGVMFRCGGDRYFPMPSYEAQIMPQHKDDSARLYKYNAKELQGSWPASVLIPANEWVTHEVIAEGGHVTVRVNGKTALTYDDPEPIPVGGIVLQLASPETTVQFRKVEIMELR